MEAMAQLITTDPLVAIHEGFHELGYDDRYDASTGLSLYPEGLMLAGGGGGAPIIGDYQFADLLDFAIETSKGQSGQITLTESTVTTPSKIIKGKNGEPNTEIVGGQTQKSNLVIDKVDNKSTTQRDVDLKKSERVKNVTPKTVPNKAATKAKF